MAGFRQLPPPPQSPHRTPMYHHPMANHSLLYPHHNMHAGPLNQQQQQHHQQHHHMITRHHMVQQQHPHQMGPGGPGGRQMIHHGMNMMTPSMIPLNASKLVLLHGST